MKSILFFITGVVCSFCATPMFAQGEQENCNCKEKLKSAYEYMNELMHSEAENALHLKLISAHYLKSNLSSLDEEPMELEVFKLKDRSYLFSKDYSVFQDKATSVRVNHRLKTISVNGKVRSKEEELLVDRFVLMNRKMFDWTSSENCQVINEHGKNLLKITFEMNATGQKNLHVKRLEFFVNLDENVLEECLGYFTKESKYSFAKVEIREFEFQSDFQVLKDSPMSQIMTGKELKTPYRGYQFHDNRHLKLQP